MKKTLGILLGITAVAVVGMIIYRRRNEDTGTMLQQVSDEGYETAHDVLFPKKSKKDRGLDTAPYFPTIDLTQH